MVINIDRNMIFFVAIAREHSCRFCFVSASFLFTNFSMVAA